MSTRKTPAEASQTNHVASESAGRSPKRIAAAGQRRAEIAIAALFLITAVASIPAAFLVDPILKSSDYLTKVYPNKGTVELGALLWSINNIGIVFIAVFALPVLRKLDETLAIGYLACRIVEGTIQMVGVIAYLLLITVSQAFIKAGAPHHSWYQTLGDVFKHLRFLGLTEVSLPLLGLGGLIFTWMLFRFGLVPRFIAVVGLIGYALVLLVSIAGWFDVVDTAPGASGAGSVLVLPVAVFEIILLPFWLLFRGFTMPEAPERTP